MSDDDDLPPITNVVNAKDLFGKKTGPAKSDIDEIVDTFNLKYGKCVIGDKFRVIVEKPNNKTGFMIKKDFEDSNAHIKVPIMDGNTGALKYVPAARVWLEHPKALMYRDVIFDPSKSFDRYNDKIYNLWRGFAVEPIEGKCCDTLGYIKKRLCSDDDNHFGRLIAWVSHMFQKPWELPGTAVAIQGEEEGTGKSFFPLILSRLLDGKVDIPTLFFKASNAKMITGDFTGHLEHCLLVHAEEAFRAESDREDSIIKDLITGEYLPINPKGLQAKLVKNYTRLILTGNPSHIVKASRFARRFFVLKLSDGYEYDVEYFTSILNELEHGGYEALMHYFMTFDISKYDLRLVPKTLGLLEQKLESLKNEERFWYNMLWTGELRFDNSTDSGNHYKPNFCRKEFYSAKYVMINLFKRSIGKDSSRNRSDEVSFGMKFSKFFMNENGEKTLRTFYDGKCNYYVIPSLDVARQLFDHYLRQKVAWPDIDDWREKQFGND
jgi:hypothetical protein